MGGRSLSAEENERVVAAVKEMLRGGGTQVALAGRLKVDQATLSSLLAGRHSAGFPFARKLAALMGVPVEELLSGKRGPVGTSWRDLPGVETALEEARRQFPGVSAEAWAWVGELSGSPPPSLAPVFFWTLATAYSNAPRDVVPESVAVARGRSGVQKKGAK